MNRMQMTLVDEMIEKKWRMLNRNIDLLIPQHVTFSLKIQRILLYVSDK